MGDAFDEIQFPPSITYGSKGSFSGWETDVARLDSGFEKRNQRWAGPLGEWTVGHLKGEAQIAALIAFHALRHGRARGFRLKDHAGHSITAEIIGMGAGGAGQTFQLVKKYSDPLQTLIREIKKPVGPGIYVYNESTGLFAQAAETVKIYFDGALQSGGWSVDHATGLVTAAPGNGVVVTADCEFDVPVRFDTDKAEISHEDYGADAWSNIAIVGIRV